MSECVCVCIHAHTHTHTHTHTVHTHTHTHTHTHAHTHTHTQVVWAGSVAPPFRCLSRVWFRSLSDRASQRAWQGSKFWKVLVWWFYAVTVPGYWLIESALNSVQRAWQGIQFARVLKSTVYVTFCFFLGCRSTEALTLTISYKAHLLCDKAFQAFFFLALW